MERLIGNTLGQYRVMSQLGRGGMAEVYKAYQPSLDRYVAIKVMYPHLADDSSFVQRFEREARAVARLQHPNILQVFDFGTENGYHYMVMPFIDGTTLKQRLIEYEGLLPPRETVRIITDVASALRYAHGEGMVHRDIKSANVMINKGGAVFLTDFGIAKMLEGPTFTVTGSAIGTPEYMSPEQCLGEKIDGRSDIYSLGIVLYEMSTGRVPFTADTPFAVATAQLTKALPLPRQINPNLPDPVERVILKALAKNPDDRYQTADEFAEGVREILPAWERGLDITVSGPAVTEEKPAAAATISVAPKETTTAQPVSGGSSLAETAVKPAAKPEAAATSLLNPADAKAASGTDVNTPAASSDLLAELQRQPELVAKIAMLGLAVLVMFCGSGLVFAGWVGSNLTYRTPASQVALLFCVLPGLAPLAAAGMLQFRRKARGFSSGLWVSLAFVGFSILLMLLGSFLILNAPPRVRSGSSGPGLFGALAFIIGLAAFVLGIVLWFRERKTGPAAPVAEPTAEPAAKP